MKTKNSLLLGSILAGTAVILGALGAHGLKPLITPEQLTSYETGVRYQVYHAFALLLIVAFDTKLKPKFRNLASGAFILGIGLFSGSIYLLSLHDLIGLTNYKWLGPITPLGGLCFIAGWIFVGIGALKSDNA